MRVGEYYRDNDTVFDASLEYPTYMNEELREKIDLLLMNEYPFHIIRPTLEKIARMFYERDLKRAVIERVRVCALRNAYKWGVLLETEGYEYDPIYNYDRKEEEHITRVKGEQNNTTSIGEVRVTDTDASRTNTDTGEISAENVSGWSNDNKRTTEIGGGTDTSVTSAHTDSSVDGERTDGEDRELVVKGNIGTVTTQDMIEQERGIADFSALAIIVNDIAFSFSEVR